jgi:hypothetical protein
MFEFQTAVLPSDADPDSHKFAGYASRLTNLITFKQIDLLISK